MAKRFLKAVKSSTDAIELDHVQTKRPRHLRVVSLPEDMRLCKARLQNYFTQSIVVDKVWDFLMTAIARSFVAIASFIGAAALPVCALLPWLNADSKFCRSCTASCTLAGAGFVEYVLEHHETLPSDGFISCIHRGHCWMPTEHIVKLLGVDGALFQRKFINVQQVFDATSFDFHVFMKKPIYQNLTTGEKKALHFLYRSWFNDYQRFAGFVRILYALDLELLEWMEERDVVKTCANALSFSAKGLDEERLAQALLIDVAYNGGQPRRGYLNGTYKCPAGMSKVAHVAKIAFQLAVSRDDKIRAANWVGEYSIYEFTSQIDAYYCEQDLPKSKRVSDGAASVMAYVGPGCPLYLYELAPAYMSSSAQATMKGSLKAGETCFYGKQFRKPHEVFLVDAAAALEKIPLYRHLREHHLIPKIHDFNLEGVACERRKPKEAAYSSCPHRKPHPGKLRLWQKLCYQE